MSYENYYISINAIANEDVLSFMHEVADALRSDDGNVRQRFIPTQGEGRIEIVK